MTIHISGKSEPSRSNPAAVPLLGTGEVVVGITDDAASPKALCPASPQLIAATAVVAVS